MLPVSHSRFSESVLLDVCAEVATGLAKKHIQFNAVLQPTVSPTALAFIHPLWPQPWLRLPIYLCEWVLFVTVFKTIWILKCILTSNHVSCLLSNYKPVCLVSQNNFLGEIPRVELLSSLVKLVVSPISFLLPPPRHSDIGFTFTGMAQLSVSWCLSDSV